MKKPTFSMLHALRLLCIRPFPWFLTLGILLPVAPGFAAAAAPPFPADGVAVVDVMDNFDVLRRHLSSWQSRVDATYSVAVLKNLRSPERPWIELKNAYFLNGLFEAWQAHLNLETYVLILLAVERGEVRVRVGSRWALLGFDGQDEISAVENSRFSLFYQAGDYPGALLELIAQLDKLLYRKQSEQADSERRLQESFLALAKATQALERHPSAHRAYVQEKLTASARDIQRAREASAAGRITEAETYLEVANSAVQRAYEALEFRRTLWRQSLFILLGLFIVASVVFVLHRRSSRAQARFFLKVWEDRLSHAVTRLMALANDNPLLFASSNLGHRLKGESLQLFVMVGRQADDLFLKFDTAQGLAAQVKSMIDGASWWIKVPLSRVIGMLSFDVVRLEASNIREHRLFLPERPIITMPAEELLADMDELYQSTTEGARRLENALVAADAFQAELTAVFHKIREELNRLQDLKISTHVYEAEARASWQQAQLSFAEVASDPLTVTRNREENAMIVQPLATRCKAAVQIARRLEDELLPSLAEVEMALNGPFGKEPGLSLERRLWELSRRVPSVRNALAEGKCEDASRVVEDAIEEALKLIAKLRACEEFLLQGLSITGDLMQRCQALRAVHPDRMALLADLQRCFASECLKGVQRDLERLPKLFDEVTGLIRQAEVSLRDSPARPLAAMETLDQAQSLFDQILSIINDLEQWEEQNAKRDETRRHLQAAHALVGKALSIGQEWASEIGVWMNEAAELSENIKNLEREMEQELPNWLSLHARSLALFQAAFRACEDGRKEQRARHAVDEITPTLLRQRDRIEAMLDSSSADRALTNERFKKARALLAAGMVRLPSGHPDWWQRLARLKEAEAVFAEVSMLASADFRADEHARACLADAMRAQAAYVGEMGNENHLSQQVVHHVMRARTHLHAQEYEQAADVALFALELVRPSLFARDGGFDAFEVVARDSGASL